MRQVLSDTQIINTLASNSKWDSPVIYYSFPAEPDDLRYESPEKWGIKPLNDYQKQAFHVAISTWNDLIPQDIIFTENHQESLIQIAYTNTNISYGHAYLPPHGNIWLGLDYEPMRSPSIGNYAFNTYVHELGHTLGLVHMGNYDGEGDWQPSSYQDSSVYSIMSYFGPDISNEFSDEIAWGDWVAENNLKYYAQTPMLSDILAIQSMYGIGQARSDDTIYGFGSNVTGFQQSLYNFEINKTPIMTLYDTGGNDTLDLSGWSYSNSVNLTPGSFSSGNAMTNNIAIAQNTWIENVETGSGNDFVIGNAANNTIITGGGNDSITASSGVDWIDGGAGSDTIIFEGSRSEFLINASNNTIKIEDTLGRFDVTNIMGVENIKFLDGVISASELIATHVDHIDPSLTLKNPVVPDVEGAIYRFYNFHKSVHFYTASHEEASHVASSMSDIFNFEGIAYYEELQNKASAVDIHRFYNKHTNVHFYTASKEEADSVQANLAETYIYEGIAFRANKTPDLDDVGVHRFYNTNTGAHFYTADLTEANSLSVYDSFIYEGIAYYVNP